MSSPHDAWAAQFGNDWLTCPACGRCDALSHYRYAGKPFAKCWHLNSCGWVAGYDRGRWNEKGDARHGADADHWLTAVIRHVARSTNRTDLAAYRVALALKPLAAAFGPDDLHPSINTLSELTASSPRDVRAGLRRLSQLGFITARRPTRRTDLPIRYRLTVNELSPEEHLREVPTGDPYSLGVRIVNGLNPRLLHRGGISDRAVRGLLALAEHGPGTAPEIAAALGLSKPLAWGRLVACTAAGLTVTGAPAGVVTFDLAAADDLCAVTGAALARVAPVIERTDLAVTKRRDEDTRWRRDRRVRDVALGFADYHPHDDERLRDVRSTTTLAELATLSPTRPGGHPLRRLLASSVPDEQQRSTYAYGELRDVVTKGRRYVIPAHRPLVGMLHHGHATELYDYARQTLDRNHRLVVDLWRRREQLAPSRSITDLVRETGRKL